MIHWVSDDLAWGDAWSVREAVEDKKFTAICQVGVGDGHKFSYLKEPGKQAKIHKDLYFADHDPFPVEKVKEAADWVAEQLKNKEKVYVHCMEGNFRSVAVIVAYLTLHRAMKFEDAEALIYLIKPKLTLSGKPTDEDNRLRGWFRRDWKKYLESREE